jgi:hypothetical protein
VGTILLAAGRRRRRAYAQERAVTKRPTKREEIEWQKRERERLAQIHRHLSGRRFRDKSPLIDLISEIDRDLDPKPLLYLFDPPLTSEELAHIRPHLEDLFDRLTLTFKRTRKDRRPPLLSLFDRPHTSEELAHIRPHLEDLFDHLTFKRTRKDRRPPSYMRTEQQHKLLQALYDVKNRPDGVKQAEAITKAAQKRGVSESALKLAAQGQHTSLRHQGRGHK